MRPLVPLLLVALLGACTSPTPDSSGPPVRRADTLSRFRDGAPRVVAISQGGSVVERRTYRATGTLLRVDAGDSVRGYLDLHDPDSAAILQDFLRGRWRNLSAESSAANASVFYVFGPDRLTFKNAKRTALESLRVEYGDNRTLTTEYGMSVRPTIASFDTVRVTGFTLVRRPPADSTQ
ncbi:MAG: hypothetical protein ABEL97_10170 [Salinibacter sp.]